jgi:hypothetical protein
MAQFYRTRINNVSFEIQTNDDGSIYMKVYSNNEGEFVGFDTDENGLKELSDFLGNYFN